MGRTTRGTDGPTMMPTVEKVELSEKNIPLRFAIVIILIVVGAVSLTYGVRTLFSKDAGWTEIAVNPGAKANCSSEFVFMYELGTNGISATAENKALVTIYTDAIVKAYELFHSRQAFENVNNLYYINQHPNQIIEVDAVLYKSFEQVQKANSRFLYLAPIYQRYDDIFLCEEDYQLVDFDPYLNDEVAKEYMEIASYARNPEFVDLQLLGENKVQLYVSEEYMRYAEENYITDFVDFFWMKNAFIVDFLTETLKEKGYTAGSISSYDGFVSNLDSRGLDYAYNIFNREEKTIYKVGVMHYNEPRNIVYLRDYPMNALDENHYYELEDGSIRTPYIDVQNGLSRTAVPNMICYASDKGCAEVVLQMAPVFVGESFEKSALDRMAEEGIYTIYCENGEINYNDIALMLED